MRIRPLDHCSICDATGHTKGWHRKLPSEIKCKYCNNIYSIENFQVRTIINFDNEKLYFIKKSCKECKNNRESERRRSSLKKYFSTRVSDIKSRCKRFKINFNLTCEDLELQYEKQNGKCYYSKLPLLICDGNKSRQRTITVDRKNPKEGYIANNIVLVPGLINSMKLNNTEERFKYLCNLISERFKS